MQQIQNKWLSQLKQAIGLRINIPEKQLSLGTNLRDDLNLDPLDFNLLIADLERKFNVYLSQEQISSIQTLQDAFVQFSPRSAAA